MPSGKEAGSGRGEQERPASQAHRFGHPGRGAPGHGRGVACPLNSSLATRAGDVRLEARITATF